VDVVGQNCDLQLDLQNVGKGGKNRLTIKTNVEQVGDVSVTLSQAGYTDRSKNDKVAKANEAKVNVNLNKFASEANADLTASVDYEIASQDAAVNVGYKNGDVSVKLKSARSGAGDLSHKVNLNYAIEGVDAGLEINDKLSGKITVSKDGFTLEVPVSKDGVDHKNAKLEKSWSMELASARAATSGAFFQKKTPALFQIRSRNKMRTRLRATRLACMYKKDDDVYCRSVTG
jgi:autotransporter translocation and assembly factor TamB